MGMTLTEKIMARASGRDELRAGEIAYPKADLATIHDLYVVEADRQLTKKRQKWRTHKVDPYTANMGDHVFTPPPATRIGGLVCPNLTTRSITTILFMLDHSLKNPARVMKRAQEVTETPDAADAFDPVMSKEGEMHDSRRQKDDSPASLPAGSVRRSPPGRGGLPGVAAAAGLALLLSACGGGGAGAPNAGAALGGSAPSIQADAAVASALVAATPDARNSPPEAKETPPPKTPPGAEDTPPPTGLPPVAETTPPQTQEPPAPTDRYTVTDEKVNMNTFGTWGHPDYQPGGASAARNNGPKVVVRRRVERSHKDLTLPISGGVDFPYTSIYYGTVGIDNLWLTYPAVSYTHLTLPTKRIV